MMKKQKDNAKRPHGQERQTMTLTGHLKELRNRLAICIVCLIVSSLAGLHFAPGLVELLTDWVRRQGGTAVTGEAAKENRASCALLEKCGFTAVRESSFNKYRMNVRFDSMIYQKTLR